MSVPTRMLIAMLPLLMGAADAQVTVPITVHVARSASGSEVADKAWLDARLHIANRLFAPASIRFVATTGALAKTGDDQGDVMTVPQRHRLATQARRDGTIHVFVVGRLADKDRQGALINGVMWYYAGRSRKLSGRRYVIVSNTSPPQTLAHELGHFFLLKHTTAPHLVMTTRSRQRSASFAPWQLRKIRRSLRVFRRSRLVRPHPPATR